MYYKWKKERKVQAIKFLLIFKLYIIYLLSVYGVSCDYPEVKDHLLFYHHLMHHCLVL